MPQQAPLRLVKLWRRNWPRDRWPEVPRGTRGFYVLYKNVRPRVRADVMYIGISSGKRGVRSRLRSHARKKPDWTHFSYFEVHDNITADEVRELEALLLQIFRHDSRVRLTNVQKGSKKFAALRREPRANKGERAMLRSRR